MGQAAPGSARAVTRNGALEMREAHEQTLQERLAERDSDRLPDGGRQEAAPKCNRREFSPIHCHCWRMIPDVTDPVCIEFGGRFRLRVVAAAWDPAGILPPRRERPVRIELPRLQSLVDVATAMAAIAAAEAHVQHMCKVAVQHMWHRYPGTCRRRSFGLRRIGDD